MATFVDRTRRSSQANVSDNVDVIRQFEYARTLGLSFKRAKRSIYLPICDSEKGSRSSRYGDHLSPVSWIANLA